MFDPGGGLGIQVAGAAGIRGFVQRPLKLQRGLRRASRRPCYAPTEICPSDGAEAGILIILSKDPGIGLGVAPGATVCLESNGKAVTLGVPLIAELTMSRS